MQINILAYNWNKNVAKCVQSREGPLEKSNSLTRDEVVEFGNLLYGSAWRDILSNQLNISRKQLVLTLASDEPLPESITLPLLSLIEGHVQEQEQQRRKMALRVAEIRQATKKSSQPKIERKSAS